MRSTRSRLTSTLLTLSAALVLAAATTPVTAPAQQVVKKVSEKEMERILRKMGLEPTNPKTDRFVFELNGYRVQLNLMNEQTDARISVAFGDKTVTAKRMNDWNADRRFARAYADSDENPVLDSDLDFAGGVTEDAITAWIRLFRDQTGLYVKFLNEKP